MKRLPLEHLHRECTFALPLYIHLATMAGKAGRITVTTDRAKIAALFGVKADTVTKAMKTLRDAGLLRWRVRARMKNGTRWDGKYYVISLQKAPLKVFCVIGVLPQKAPQKGFSGNVNSDRKHPKRGSVSSKEDTAGRLASPPAPPAPAPDPKKILTFSEAANILGPAPEGVAHA